MKAVAIFLMLTLMNILNVESVLEIPIDCSGYEKLSPGKPQMCTLELTPICASDGQTYGNKCAFCHAVKQSDDNIKFVHMGNC
ncbi:serine protease inhibitor Kazal-type 9 [Sarcophilus harrisii]|uniref:serine protease inhibitor Kazal-type 9 n=1 Tax=Sarcophilus harrisii TaxID=9305 RepID=UPI001301FCB3|nr:serine protease inhibitor Kazal-type 9 [Sarcophilus harrisii]